jgi:hypothetical protein
VADDSTDAGKRRYVEETLEMRSIAHDLLIDSVAPEVPNYGIIDPPEVTVKLHAATLSYWHHVAPRYREVTAVDWTDNTLVELPVPASGRHDAGHTDTWGEYDTGDIWEERPRTQKPVKLGTLGLEWGSQNRVEVTVTVDGGEEVDTLSKTLYLPPAACRTVIEHLDRSISDLGWVPGSNEIDVDGNVAPGGAAAGGGPR